MDFLKDWGDKLEAHFIKDQFWTAFFATIVLSNWRVFVVLFSGMDPMVKIETAQTYIFSSYSFFTLVLALSVAGFRSWFWPGLALKIEERRFTKFENFTRLRNTVKKNGSVDISHFYGAIVLAQRIKKDWKEIRSTLEEIRRINENEESPEKKLKDIDRVFSLYSRMEVDIEFSEKEMEMFGKHRHLIALAVDSGVESLESLLAQHETTKSHAEAITRMTPRA